MLDNGWILMQSQELEKTFDFNKGYTPLGFAEKVYHLHIKPLGNWDELYFRDYLQKHSDIANQYAELKHNLKDQFEHNRDAYTNAKSDFILTHTQKAKEEFPNRYIEVFKELAK